MRMSSILKIPVGVTLAALLFGIHPALAANYPLELTNIKPAGTGGLDGACRIYRAYPGLEYNIRAAVIGGAYPYTFSLANAPPGMTIDTRGTISWGNPQATATPTITVRDSEGAQVSATWTIGVTAAGFRFVDAVNGNAAPQGTGTFANPWRTMADVYNNASPTDIIYFRAGTYNQLSLPRSSVGTAWERVEWPGVTKPVVWLAYPGEGPVIDFGYRLGVEAGPLIRISGVANRPPYIDGFEGKNIGIIGFQTGSPATFRRLKMHDLLLGGDGTNASFIMTVTQTTPVVGMVIQDSEFSSVNGVSCTIKIYAQEKLLIEDTVHRRAQYGLELKFDARRYTVRNNLFYGISNVALGGNMHGVETNGEILFNTVLQPGSGQIALDVNQDGMAGGTYVYRNTLIGRVRVRNVDSQDGPFYFANNVIVNSDAGTASAPHIYYESVTAADRVTCSSNLVGYPNDTIVDASGRLTSTYSNYRSTYGSYGQTLAPANIRTVP